MASITELVDIDYATEALIRLLAIDSVTGHEAAIGAAIVAVSYTHLTLPTKA